MGCSGRDGVPLPLSLPPPFPLAFFIAVAGLCTRTGIPGGTVTDNLIVNDAPAFLPGGPEVPWQNLNVFQMGFLKLKGFRPVCTSL